MNDNHANVLFGPKPKGSKGRRNAQDQVRHNAETITQTARQAVVTTGAPTPGSRESTADSRSPADPRSTGRGRRYRSSGEYAADLYGGGKS